jgi:hypothetical protein
MIVTDMAAASDEIPAVGRSMADILLIVSIPFFPSIMDPRITKIEESIMAVVNLTILEETAVPKILAASFAPRDHPRYRAVIR